MPERCLITGSHGLIGEKLVARLTELGHICRRFKRIEWANPERVIWDFEPTMAFHLAAYGNHSWQQDIDEIYHANISNLLCLLEACKNRRLKAFINVGSSSEYGQKAEPMSEQMNLEPLTHYGAGKAAGTMICRAWAIQQKMPIVTVRPFSVYGPGEDARRFIPTIIRCAMTGEVLDLAPGTHDWIYVDDLVDGILEAADNAGNLAGRAINLGTGKERSNDEVVRIVGQALKKKVKVNLLEKKIRDYDTYFHWVADISLAQSLGWRPKIELEEGVKMVYESLKKSNSGN